MRPRFPVARVPRPLRARLDDEVECDHCHRPALKAAAVFWRKKWLHPFGCTPAAIEAFRLQLEAADAS